MTAEQYWEGDCTLVKYYRKAEELRNEKRNQELWLQGMYVYEAICDVAPILHAFAKKGTKPTPYSEKPYPLNAKQSARDEEEKQRRLTEKGKRFMEAMATSINKKFEGKTQLQE
jgi:phage-related protein